MSRLTRHLDDVGETYCQHLRHALSFALAMLGGAVACLVRRLHDRMVVNRRNLTPGAAEIAAGLRRS